MLLDSMSYDKNFEEMVKKVAEELREAEKGDNNEL